MESNAKLNSKLRLKLKLELNLAKKGKKEKNVVYSGYLCRRQSTARTPTDQVVPAKVDFVQNGVCWNCVRPTGTLYTCAKILFF